MPRSKKATNKDSSEAEGPKRHQRSDDHSKEVVSRSDDGSSHDDSSQSAGNSNSSNRDSDASSRGDGHKKCLKGKCFRSDDSSDCTQSCSEPDSNQPSSNDWETETSSDKQGETTKCKGKGKAKKGKKNLKPASSTETPSVTEASTNEASSSDIETSSHPESSVDNASTDPKDSSKASTRYTCTTNSKQGFVAHGPEWSLSEDCLLRSMKEGDNPATWAAISAVLNRPKSQVRSRWSIIKDLPPHRSADFTIEPEPVSSSDQVTDSSSAENDSANIKKGKGKGKQVSKATKGHRGARNDKVAFENKQTTAKATKIQEESRQSLSGDGASFDSATSSSSLESSSLFDGGYGCSDKRHEMRYLQDHIYADLYPVDIRPKPDAHLGKRDCELLGAIESKLKRSKWLEMQANFFNVTGRMVPLDAIRARCERAEEVVKPKPRPTAKELAARLERVEKWLSKLSQEEDSEES
ncbi:hypothetical protein B0J13DRAFT_266358 [Dactylonectria estremocensis]|uniref:Myb-like domain-containing protein n=1 Tax=Dactylonectria estremocensis TaxID=1079267 RepID=A0A9P9J630_9HYPO|nr:hypothetical protein B0J13DRAFT_266358 [Dactylonectria estremocensis]